MTYIRNSLTIIGGGPAGLAVARLLHVRGMPTTVLEHDAGPEARTQGGSLDLGPDGGLLAIREMGLQPGFDAVARPLAQTRRILSPAGDVLADLDERHYEASRPEIDRVDLRRIMLEALPTDAVRWGTAVAAISPLPDGGHRITAEDGEVLHADLVIACDGIGSRARPLLTDERATYCGITFLRGDIARPDPGSALARWVGEGAMFAIGVNRAVLAQRNGDGSIHLYAALRTPESSTRTRGSRAELARLFEGWHPDLLAALDAVDDGFAHWPLHTVPAEQHWAPHRGITLVGDAAHVMPPFTGEGVNMALLDAVELVEALTSIDDRDAAIATYERAMLARMAPAVAAANAAGDVLLSPRGAASLLGKFEAVA